MRTRCYIAGPISKGDLKENVRVATEAAIDLLKAGYAPFCPHLTCYMAGPKPEVLPCGTKHEDWYETDLPWVAVSDCVLRLPGFSKGADLETDLANSLNIPVFRSVKELKDGIEPNDDSGRCLPAEAAKPAGNPRFHQLLQEMANLHAAKAADYGSDADPLANIRGSTEIGIPAWKAAWLRGLDKVRRINRFCQRGSLVNEGVADSLKDLAAYALIALVMLEEHGANSPG